MIEIIATAGVFLGCLSRALLPFFKKKHKAVEEGKDIRWEGRYVWTIVFAIIASFITTMLILPSFEMPSANIFPFAFGFGWAAQDVINRIAK